MSRSSPTLTNPAAHFYEWKAGAGKLHYYDKEKATNIEIKLPFEFLVLDELATITGFSRPDNASYYSNEVRNSAKEEFTVKLKGQVRYVGLYKNDQQIVQTPKAAKYTKSIYIAHKEGEGFIIANLKAPVGSALSAWIDFTQKHKVQNGKIILTKGEPLETPNGDTYYPPHFEYVSASKEEDAAAIALDKDLQVYLSQYLAANAGDHDDEVSHDAIDPELGKATPEQVADFEARKTAKFERPQAETFEDKQSVYNQVAAADYPEDDAPPFTDDDLPLEFRG